MRKSRRLAGLEPSSSAQQDSQQTGGSSHVLMIGFGLIFLVSRIGFQSSILVSSALFRVAPLQVLAVLTVLQLADGIDPAGIKPKF